ncbi:xanthine dehydrogenase family protein molybdopterin-binding subunit [Mycolicibacterium tokaiense]|uniref:Xanthine dehydrogenase, molybdenum binding subunit apoprotein n=1 Tax=Mycolicibacterium tokaiense TaxID=39695 RepID=A0A378TPQ3_9MYCO|nr:xanthine dehydrogenase family protein molybdopterin-binding subunit [Mycolicibacterium tokaiense]BBY90000.1 carbon-monoxide dehydrogenase large subunit [Mycolicibacterium tokaiense]STZ61616.1 xanthine dehydrogenase, molybdenum binding subunit apoprotein [Mycolicibacterium tokaiense]
MTTPLGANISRVDGRVKTTGAARYPADYRETDTATAVLVTSTVGLGRITGMDTDAATQAPGVIAVYTPFAPLRLEPVDPSALGENYRPLQDQEVRFRGQAIGVVVADTFEHARDAAAMITASYDERAPRTSLADAGAGVSMPAEASGNTTILAPGVGSIDSALGSSEVTVDITVSQQAQHAAAMEPHASLAVWNGDQLTMYTGTQFPGRAVVGLTGALGLRPDQLRIISTYVGGGFGSRVLPWADAVLAAAAARELRRPVRLVLSRTQVFTVVGHRSAVRQRIRLGARADGTLNAVSHESDSEAPAVGGWPMRTAADTSAVLYRTPNLHVDQRQVTLDTPPTWATRAPNEAPGGFAIETAMDELAIATGVDPVELRLRNYATVVPGTDRRWTSKRLDECYRVGAARFGWNRRAAPGTTRDGQWLVGMGMATAIYPASGRAENAVRVRFRDDGTVLAQSGTMDIGTGSATALAIVVADALGLPMDRVAVEVGDTALPPGAGAVGSRATGSLAPTARTAARAAVAQLVEAAGTDPNSPLAESDTPVTYDAGMLRSANADIPFADLLRGLGRSEIEATHADENIMVPYAAHGFGAHFCEVRVNSFTGETRVSRFTTVVDIGRVINVKTARSQVVGGVIFGIGHALLEANPIEPSGRMAAANLADYVVPVNADVPFIDAVCLDGDDPDFSEVGARGVGELGVVGSAAAIGNAVFNATGIRIYDLPIHPEKLLR